MSIILFRHLNRAYCQARCHNSNHSLSSVFSYQSSLSHYVSIYYNIDNNNQHKFSITDLDALMKMYLTKIGESYTGLAKEDMIDMAEAMMMK